MAWRFNGVNVPQGGGGQKRERSNASCKLPELTRSCPKGMIIFFAGVSAAKKKDESSLRAPRLCGEILSIRFSSVCPSPALAGYGPGRRSFARDLKGNEKENSNE